MIQFEFNEKKAIEAIIFLVKRFPNADVYKVCKLLYLVDKTSLEKYGRFVFGESYCAMSEGAVPSNAYDLLKKARTEELNGFKVNGNQIVTSRDANLDFLSNSDIECLDQTISIYKSYPGWLIRYHAHDEAWRKNWEKRGLSNSIPIPIEDIVQLVDDSENLIEYLNNCD